MPVWRTAPSDEYPTPPNEFNGVLALMIDINRLAEVYLGPALDGPVRLDDWSSGWRRRSSASGWDPAPQACGRRRPMRTTTQEQQGTTILDDADGRRLHAWARSTPAANVDRRVVCAVRPRRGQIQRSATGAAGAHGHAARRVAARGLADRAPRTARAEEQRRLERQLAESQKMEAIGKLAGGVAHDFNNMLTAILGYASMIHEDAPASSPIREHSRQIRRAAESAAALTQKLLAFSRRQVLQSDQVDFAPMVDNLLLLIRRVIGENITVTFDAERGPVADPGRPGAGRTIDRQPRDQRARRDAGGRHAQILARNPPRPRGERRGDVEVRPGEYVQITVADTGAGMDEATRARMFEPFFTTKPHRPGTGLGLSTVYGFVKQCGGYVTVQSAPGAGTAIELLLPRAPAAEPSAAPITPPALLPRAGAAGARNGAGRRRRRWGPRTGDRVARTARLPGAGRGQRRRGAEGGAGLRGTPSICC